MKFEDIDWSQIPPSEIRPEVRELAVSWAGGYGMTWILDKQKFASDVQRYADWYADQQKYLSSR